ncbi:hypothetical protein K0U83_15055 [bacterium]|nr:hypothetical protein [bacterium]
MQRRMYVIVDKSIGMVLPTGGFANWLDLSLTMADPNESVPRFFRSPQEAEDLIRLFGEQRSGLMAVIPVEIEINADLVYGGEE